MYTGPVTTTPPLTTTEEFFTRADTDPETDMETTVSVVTGTEVQTDPLPTTITTDRITTVEDTPQPEAFGEYCLSLYNSIL